MAYAENIGIIAQANIRRLYDLGGNKADVKMSQWIGIAIAGILSGMAASLGLGGGTVLLIYLTAIISCEQMTAQGINLIFFIPIAMISIIIHSKRGMIKWKTALTAAIFGLIGAALGWYVGGIIHSGWLSKIFAVLLLILGARELFSKKEESKTQQD